jgi:hypothetical protein
LVSLQLMNLSSELTSGSMLVIPPRAHHAVFLTSGSPTGILPAIQERQARCKIHHLTTPQLVADIIRQYLNAIWNVINFKEAEKRYIEAKN